MGRRPRTASKTRPMRHGGEAQPYDGERHAAQRQHPFQRRLRQAAVADEVAAPDRPARLAAAALGGVAAQADGIFLSPVFPTASHPGAATLGAAGFHALADRSPVPVIALGGMSHERARELDWPRWGAIDGLGSTKAA